jgi:pyruvate formate lyase activating enzyme
MECDPPEEGIRWEEVREFLVRRKGMLSGVVFCGGEPTLQEDLVERIAEVAEMGFKVKLDTNGSHPNCLAKALNYLSFVAMDLKAPFGEAYDRVCGARVDQEAVKKSMALLRASKVPYMFRTTISPDLLSPSEVEDIKSLILSGEDYRVTQAQRVQSKSS